MVRSLESHHMLRQTKQEQDIPTDPNNMMQFHVMFGDVGRNDGGYCEGLFVKLCSSRYTNPWLLCI